MVNDGDTVMLDSGTTTFEIARAIRTKKITIITNSATIISDFINYGHAPAELVCIGGIFRPNFRCFVGSETENFIRKIIPDKVFIAANGFSVTHGASTPMLVEASVKRAMLGAGKHIFLAIDSSKMGNDYLSVIAPPEDFDGIITDRKLSRRMYNQLINRGLTVYTENTKLFEE
jgi:DeoR/GlpR family transcriptional regulator of sugar metabolism